MVHKQPQKSVSENFKLIVNDQTLIRTNTVKYLGITIDENLACSPHLKHVSGQLATYALIFYRMRHYATKDVLSMAYFALVYSKLQYGILVWGGTAAMKYLSEIRVDMNKIVRAITLSYRYSPLSPLDTKLKFLKLTKISELELAKFMHQLQNNKLPKRFQDLFYKIELCMVTIPDMHHRIYIFDQE